MWTAASLADGFLVELTNEESEDELPVLVPGDQYNRRAPEEWIVSGIEYQASVGIVDVNDSITSVESSNFTID
jgi:hypothetical protein